MAPIVRELDRRGADYFILHTGQHYTPILDELLFSQLCLGAARYNLGVGSGSHAEQTARMLVGVEAVLKEERPDLVLVEGDTNSVLAGALVASKMHMKVGHVEAGLRSHDRRMPEEINRIMADHCSDHLFAPTQEAAETLAAEGVPSGRVFVTGNTIVDAVYQHLEMATHRTGLLNLFGLRPKEYFLVTLHRAENVDDRERFTSILEGLDQVAAQFCLPVIYPIHPRSRKAIDAFGLKPGHVRLIDPVDFVDFLQLESNARLVMTDSGGVQEETCILGVPCVTLRDNTERPDTVKVGSNVLAGASPARIAECVGTMLGRGDPWVNPYGDGLAAVRIVDIAVTSR